MKIKEITFESGNDFSAILKHLKRMYAEFSVQIGKILGGYDEN